MNVDVQSLDIDFLSFSIHKMCGPSGMGGLWGRYDLLDGLEPYNRVARRFSHQPTPKQHGRSRQRDLKEVWGIFRA